MLTAAALRLSSKSAAGVRPPSCRLVVRLFSSEDISRRYKGVVKNYRGDKNFGSIRVEGTEEILFVHRSDLVCQVPLEQLPSRFPYLKARERVEFSIQDDNFGTNKNHRLAVHVTFPNGRPIPVLRQNWLSNIQNSNHLKLGKSTREILANDSWSREEKLENMENLWQGVFQEEQEATEFILRLGLNPQDYLEKHRGTQTAKPAGRMPEEKALESQNRLVAKIEENLWKNAAEEEESTSS